MPSGLNFSLKINCKIKRVQELAEKLQEQIRYAQITQKVRLEQEDELLINFALEQK